FRLIGTAAWRTFGGVIRDAVAGPGTIAEAAMRIHLDVTPVVRDPIGRRALVAMTAMGESRSSVVFARLASDPRLPPMGRSRLRSLRRIAVGFMRAGAPLAGLRMLRSPDPTRERYVRGLEKIVHVHLPADADAACRLDAFEKLVLTAIPQMIPRLLGTIMPAMLSLAAAGRILR